MITWGQNWVRVASHNRCMQFNMFWYVLYLMEYPFCCGTEGAPTSASTCLFQTIGSCKLRMSSNRLFIGFINWVWILSDISHHFILPVTVHHQRKHLQIPQIWQRQCTHAFCPTEETNEVAIPLPWPSFSTPPMCFFSKESCSWVITTKGAPQLQRNLMQNDSKLLARSLPQSHQNNSNGVLCICTCIIKFIMCIYIYDLIIVSVYI